MRRISMHIVHNDGSKTSETLTFSQAVQRVKECAYATNLVDGYRAGLPAMRDIMDEQTVTFTFPMCVINFELDMLQA